MFTIDEGILPGEKVIFQWAFYKMTIRQKFLKLFYPALSFLAGKKRGPHIFHGHKEAPSSFYLLGATLNGGNEFSFSSLRGKKVLVVNTASNCGYTAQYKALQKLSIKYPQLSILIFPSNDFKNQEPGSDEDIARFCKINYGITLPLFKRSGVIKSANQSKVFRWLSEAKHNGWNDRPPSWNFNKFLISEQGRLTHVFSEAVDPLSKEMTDALSL